MSNKSLANALHLLFLLATLSLPTLAFAVDTDGDGVQDGVDAFPNKKEASVDTDSDGMPNNIVLASVPVFESFEAPLVGWTLTPSASVGRTDTSSGRKVHSGSYAGGWIATSGPLGQFTKTTQAGFVVFWRIKALQGFGGGPEVVGLKVDGVEQTLACGTASGWQQCVAKLTSGTHTLTFTVPPPGRWDGGMFGGEWMFFLDDIAVSTLVEDQDDDNDGVADTGDAFPLNATESLDTDLDGIGNNADLDDDGDGVQDYIDAAPLSAANSNEITLPLNNGYKGSQVKDSNAVQ